MSVFHIRLAAAFAVVEARYAGQPIARDASLSPEEAEEVLDVLTLEHGATFDVRANTSRLPDDVWRAWFQCCGISAPARGRAKEPLLPDALLSWTLAARGVLEEHADEARRYDRDAGADT